MDTMDAIKLSQDMMNGRKMDLFLLNISFIGWMLLSLLTFGILSLWVAPYIQTSVACFYDETKKLYEKKSKIGEYII